MLQYSFIANEQLYKKITFLFRDMSLKRNIFSAIDVFSQLYNNFMTPILLRYAFASF